MQTALTDLAIKRLPAGTHWDSHTTGLGLRVGKNARTFIVLIKSGRRQTIGRYPTISLAEARRECARLKAHATLGLIRPERAAFEDCIRDFLADCQPRLKPLTYKLYSYHLNRTFPFGRQAIADVTPRKVIHQLDQLSPSMKEHAARIGRTFFLWAVRKHLLDASPMARIALPPKGTSRDRVLTDEELKAVYRTAMRLSGPYAAIVQLCVQTGQRRGEIAALQWSWIDFTEKLVKFPATATKNKRQHIVPLSDTSLALLEALPRLSDTFVFPAARERRAGQPATIFNSWSKSKADFDLEVQKSLANWAEERAQTNLPAKIEPWTLHDLRRTYSSGMAALGVPQIVVEKLLNHVSGGTQSPIAAVYNRHAYLAEMRQAVLLWENYIATLGMPEG